MLQRRNTIHPSQAPPQPVYASKPSKTNPFLSSSFDDLRSASYTSNHYDNDHFPHTNNPTTTTKLTDPCVYDHPAHPVHSWNTYPQDPGTDPKSNTYCSYDKTEPQNPQKYKAQHSQEDQEGGTRRLSLDLFKAPFGWHRRRRATCASSDLRRMKLEQGGGHDKAALIESAKYDWEESSQPYQQVDRYEPNENVILKSSRYHPEEQEQFGGDQSDNACLQLGKDLTSGNAGQQPQPSNPFLVPESNETNRPVESRPDLLWRACVSERRDQRQSWADQEGCESTNANPVRRRHSALSDWSIEDCPRLMAFQKKQLELELEQQEKEKQEAMEYKAMSGSRMSMTRSTTDTVLTQYQDCEDIRRHRRRASMLPRLHNAPPPSASSSYANRPRRNSVVIGRNITREQPPPRSLRTGALPRPEDELQPSHQHGEQNGSQEGYGTTREDDSSANHGSWTTTSVHPFDKPWRSGSLTRRESQSYAQDFMNDTDHWVPRPWTTASTCSSPSSPLHQRMFPHEREDHDTDPPSEEEGDEPPPESGSNHHEEQNPAYLDMRKIQLRPYGEEEEGNDNDKKSDHTNEDAYEGYSNAAVLTTEYEHEYRYNTELLSDRVDAFQDNDHDVRHYYNSVDWQRTDEHDGYHDTPSGSTLNRSRDRIARRATLAKTKFYKLLKQPPQNSHDHQHHHHYGMDEENRPDLGLDSYLDENDPSRSESSMYSVTSSLRAKMRLNSKTKTVLRQVKRRLSSAAKSVMSEANKAANNVSHAISEANKAASNKTPVSRYNTLGRKRSIKRPPSTMAGKFIHPELENVSFGLQQDYRHSRSTGAGR